MKSLLFFLALVVCVVSAIPVFEGTDGTADFVEEDVPMAFIEEPTHGLRLKRATCDATSFTSKWLTINHSACAMHCIVKGYKGGRCRDTICHCRN